MWEGIYQQPATAPAPPPTQVATALKLSEEDQATIAALKREIEKSWKMVDASHEKARGERTGVCGASRAAGRVPAVQGRCVQAAAPADSFGLRSSVMVEQAPACRHPASISRASHPTHLPTPAPVWFSANPPPQESKAKETITSLKAEVSQLQRLAEAGQALSSGEEATLEALMRQKEELTKERDEQVRPQRCA